MKEIKYNQGLTITALLALIGSAIIVIGGGIFLFYGF